VQNPMDRYVEKKSFKKVLHLAIEMAVLGAF